MTTDKDPMAGLRGMRADDAMALIRECMAQAGLTEQKQGSVDGLGWNICHRVANAAHKAGAENMRAHCADRARDAGRYRWIVANPESARHLLHLLQQGKGDADGFAKLVDRIEASERAARAPAVTVTVTTDGTQLASWQRDAAGRLVDSEGGEP